MPSTRSRGGADGAGNIAQPADQQSAASLIENSQGSDMEVNVPTDLNDRHIVQLRAAVTRAKKDLDAVTTDIKEQASVIGTAQGKDTPAATLLSYKKALKCSIDQGELKLTNFTDKKVWSKGWRCWCSQLQKLVNCTPEQLR